jgi:hypothetical protein
MQSDSNNPRQDWNVDVGNLVEAQRSAAQSVPKVCVNQIKMVVLPEHDVQSQAYKKARRQFYKTTKNRGSHTDSEWTAFRAAEKKYKTRFPPPDLSNVLDIAVLDHTRKTEVTQGGWTGRPDAIQYTEIDLKNQRGKAYVFRSHPGLVFLPAYLSHGCQRDLTRWALRDHARQPNETNLDTHYVLPEQGLWNSHVESLRQDGQVPHIQPRVSVEASTPTLMPSPPGPRQLISNTPANATNIYSLTLSASAQPRVAPSSTAHPSTPSDLIRKLRWANIGWFYHWGTKQYDFTKGKVEVDARIKEVCQSAVQAINWDDIFIGSREEQWKENSEDWRTWNETYGKLLILIIFAYRIDKSSCRTRRRDREFLSNKSVLVFRVFFKYFFAYILSGYAHGACRSIRSLCHNSSRICFVSSILFYNTVPVNKLHAV